MLADLAWIKQRFITVCGVTGSMLHGTHLFMDVLLLTTPLCRTLQTTSLRICMQHGQSALIAEQWDQTAAF